MSWCWGTCWKLTSVSGPLSAPGQQKVTNSWHRLWTTKQHTVEEEEMFKFIVVSEGKHERPVSVEIIVNQHGEQRQCVSGQRVHAYTYARANVTKRPLVLGSLITMASIATSVTHISLASGGRPLQYPFICPFFREKKKHFYSHTICLPCSLSGRLFASCALLCSSPPYLGGLSLCQLAHTCQTI